MSLVDGTRTGDSISIGLVTVRPEPPPPPDPPPLPPPPDASPTRQAQEATVEQTGADPPPRPEE